MYESFFDLKERPFAAAPSPRRYYPAPSHEESLALLQCCITENEGIGVLVGGPGTGKSLLIEMLSEAVGATHAIVRLNHIHSANVRDLLVTALHALRESLETGGDQELRLRLADYVIDRRRKGTPTLLLMDEAQHLSIEQLEELRLALNIETKISDALQLVLVGQKRLIDKLRRPELEALRQRVAVAATLTPLDADHTVEYIRSQMKCAGGAADTVFTASALSDVYAASGGVPRRINQICHRALVLAFADESGTVDSPYIDAALSSLWLPDRNATDVLQHGESAAAYRGGSAAATTRTALPHAGRTAVIEVGAGCASGGSATVTANKPEAPRSNPGAIPIADDGANTLASTDSMLRLRTKRRMFEAG